MEKKTKFNPKFKFKLGQYVIWPGYLIINVSGKTRVKTQCLGKIIDIRIYNRSNIKYRIKAEDGNYEIDKLYLEKEGRTGDPDTLKILYGSTNRD